MLCGARRARHAGAVPSTDPPLDPPRLDVPMGATSGASVKLRTISMMMLLRTPSSSALQLTSSTVAPRLGSTMALSSSAAMKGTRMAVRCCAPTKDQAKRPLSKGSVFEGLALRKFGANHDRPFSALFGTGPPQPAAT